MKFFRIFALITSLGLLTSCGWQDIPKAKNAVEGAFAEVTNQYKRRSDLIPNLVATVKGYASHEKETLEGVVAARAQATQTKVDISQLDPEAIKRYQGAQNNLTQALGRLMVVVEKYPELKADRNFLELQAQIEGTENRITVARNRYIESIQNFNNLVTVPPTSWTNSLFYHHKPMPQWDVSPEEAAKIQEVPKVDFSSQPSK